MESSSIRIFHYTRYIVTVKYFLVNQKARGKVLLEVANICFDTNLDPTIILCGSHKEVLIKPNTCTDKTNEVTRILTKLFVVWLSFAIYSTSLYTVATYQKLSRVNHILIRYLCNIKSYNLTPNDLSSIRSNEVTMHFYVNSLIQPSVYVSLFIIDTTSCHKMFPMLN